MPQQNIPDDEHLTFISEMRRLRTAGTQINLDIGPLETIIIIAHLQLALRHPDNNQETAEFATKITHQLIEAVRHFSPILADMMLLGFGPDYLGRELTNPEKVVLPTAKYQAQRDELAVFVERLRAADDERVEEIEELYEENDRLRAACRALLHYEELMDGADGDGEFNDKYWEAVKLARAAIAHAEGPEVEEE